VSAYSQTPTSELSLFFPQAATETAIAITSIALMIVLNFLIYKTSLLNQVFFALFKGFF
jgi:hypothetical protein